MRFGRLAAGAALLTFAGIPFALAQSGGGTKPGAKGPAAASASATGSGKGVSPKGSASAAASGSASAAASTSAAPVEAPSDAPTADEPPAKPPRKAAATEKDAKPADDGIAENPSTKYYFLGLRYRGTVIPQAFQKLFVNGGETVYSNTIGIEADIRKDGFSLIPAISYTEFGTGDILYQQKNKPDIAANWSLVNSSLKALFLTADMMWSTNVHKNVDVEYGFGVGLGFLFGDLVTNWVYENPNGPYSAGGHRFAKCAEANTDAGCRSVDHQNADVRKVVSAQYPNGYVEPSWFDGGSRPSVFPHIALPQIGVRIKPHKNFVARVGAGFSLAGFFFNLSADYGFDPQPKTTTSSKRSPTIRALGQPL